MLYPHGIWSRDCKSMLQQIKDQGFNCIRIPWCNKVLDPSATININSYGVDPYTGVSPMNALESTKTKPVEILDIIVDWCQQNNMKIILDNHSRQPDGYMNELLWYTAVTPESKWISDWVFLAGRYKNYDAVIAMDLNNEPHGKYGNGATWGNSNPATDWNKAAERCGNAILAVNPNVLIMVEGLEEYQNETYWWGGNLKGVADYPVQLSNQSKLVYSPHEYGPTVFNQSWFSAPDFPANMPGIWEEHFNFIHTRGISPLFVGEFGIRDPSGTDEIWFDTFMAYMSQKGYSWTFWCWNPNSGDTGGLLDDQWRNVVTWKMNKLAPHLAAEIPNCDGSIDPNLPPQASITASPTSGQPGVNVTFNAAASLDPDGVIISYSWNFGDGTTGTGTSILHNYSSAGNYTATLTVTDNEGATDQASVVITVTGESQNQAPVAAVSANPQSGIVPLQVNFSAAGSTDPDGDVLSYNWNFGDGTQGSGISVSHTYTAAGSYPATVTVNDGNGGTDAASVQIVASDPGIQQYTLATATIGSGSISLDPAGGVYDEGTSVTLTANAGAGYQFSNWSGDAGGTSASVILVMNADKTVTATFEADGGESCDDPVSINIPFVQNGTGDYCWVTSTAIAYVNSWNMAELTINGVDFTNTWSNSLPPAQNGVWVIHYVGNYGWSHFEAPQAKSAESGKFEKDVSIYPNPFTDQLIIHLGNKNNVTRIEMVTALGQVIESVEPDDQDMVSITLKSDAPNGIYLIRIHTTEKVIIKTVVKN
jgi:aryl-phospho-beta-D-glucosidase BglC (GH1 family)/chitodextrinase